MAFCISKGNVIQESGFAPTVRDGGSKLPLQGDQVLTLILGYNVLFKNNAGRGKLD